MTVQEAAPKRAVRVEAKRVAFMQVVKGFPDVPQHSPVAPADKVYQARLGHRDAFECNRGIIEFLFLQLE